MENLGICLVLLFYYEENWTIFNFIFERETKDILRDHYIFTSIYDGND